MGKNQVSLLWLSTCNVDNFLFGYCLDFLNLFLALASFHENCNKLPKLNYQYHLIIMLISGALMKVLKTAKGDLLPLNFNNDEDCQERGGCFFAGDRRVNENTALALMHTVWVRLHNIYAQFITKIFDLLPQLFKSASLSEDEKNEVIFQESRKIVIAIV